MRFRLALLRRATLALLAASPAAANLTSNPSFEDGPNPGVAVQLAVGSTAVSGWVVTRNPIDYIGTRWNAAEGVRNVSLNGTSPGGIAQTFPTVADAEYTVTFMMGGDAFANPILKHMRVTAAGQSQDYVFDATHSWEWDIGWLQHTFNFTATGSSTTLEFYSLDDGLQGPAVDQVTIEGPTTSVPIGERAGFTLSASPNPSSQGFDLRFVLPFETSLRLSVWDVAGREVRVITTGRLGPGNYQRRWNGGLTHFPAPAGLYIVRLDTPAGSLTRKVMLTR